MLISSYSPVFFLCFYLYSFELFHFFTQHIILLRRQRFLHFLLIIKFLDEFFQFFLHLISE